jgi:hypothetical protein
MKSKKLTLVFMLIFVIGIVAQVSFKKYDIKSGIITYDLIMKVGGMDMKEKTIVYFDDYGMKECKETYSNDKLGGSTFSDGKNLYIVKFNQKTAYNQGPASRGTELRVEWSEFGTEKERQAGMYKKLASKTVAGKTCEMFESNDGKGNITQYGGWNKILLYLDTQTSSVRTTLSAVKVEENVKVPPEKFQVPEGFKVQ